MPKIIALAFDAKPHLRLQIYQGVADHIRKNKLDWRVVPLDYAFESRLVELGASGRLDGIIGSFVSDEWIRPLTERGVKAVNLFHLSNIRSLPQISVDDRKIGSEAGQHLEEQGARSLTYLGRGQSLQNKLRESGLFESARKAKYICRLHLETEVRQFEAIQNMRKPVGILCTSDQLARRLILKLREAKIEVGNEALVVGIGDEAVESIFAGIEISSFRLPAAAIGAIAAKKLEAQMVGANDISRENVAAELVARASSLPTRSARLATRAYRMAEDALNDPDFNIAQMARQMGVSRRTLELSLRGEFGESPYQLLSRLRWEKASRLLEESEMRIGEVGRLCGYPELHHFSVWFKRRSHFSPKAFRQRKRDLGNSPKTHL